VQNWLKTRPKILFFDGIKETGETVEPVHWSRGWSRWKVILALFLYIFTKCAFFLKIPFNFWLTLVFIFLYQTLLHFSHGSL
jgi:hypothetical protein